MRTGHVAQNVASNASRLLIICGALYGCGSGTTDSVGMPATAAPASAAQPAGAAGAAALPGAGATMAPAAMGGPTVAPGAAVPAPGAAMPAAGAVMPPGPGMAAAGGVTYHKDIRPLLEANCVECHSGDPKFLIAPFPLHDYASVMPYSMVVVDAVMSGKMPPWPAAPDCRKIADDRSLPMETRQVFAQWMANGFAEGNAADYVAPPARRVAELGPPDLVLQMTAQYMPRTNDEYTCFGLGDDSGKIYSFPDNKYMLAVQVLPGTPNEVHHVQLHRETSPPAAGPSGCGGSAENMFSWRPGSTPLVYPTDSAALIPRGNGFMIQVHYNGQSSGGFKPDQTRVAFWFMKEGTPKNLVTREQVFGNVSIPPGQKDVTSGGGTSVPSGASVVGITPHAHMLASKMSATVTVGGKQECLVNVPKWDFHWQLDYMLAEPIPGPATIATTCVWDNTAENQPTINGMKLQPRQISFGEESLAEMCLHYIWTSRPMR